MTGIVKTAADDGGTRVSVGRLFSVLLVLIGAYRSVALVFGWGQPPADMEERLQTAFDSIWPLVSVIGAALYGIRRAIK